MPELPEVETIVQQLQKSIQEKVLKRLEVLEREYFQRNKKYSVRKFPGNEKIIKIQRRAKAIVLELERSGVLFIRLGMTGYFSHALPGEKKNPAHAKAVFHFHDGPSLFFHDIRKFGSLRFFSKKELQQELVKFGPEPLDEQFTPGILFELLQKKKKANLKTTLMDQSFIAGIGNIYAQEALYHARIDPRRRCGELSKEEACFLHGKIQRVLHKAIAAGGSTVENYRNLEGAGKFQQQLAVYQQEYCPQKHPLQRIVLGGRGTWICGRCQK